MDNLPDGFNDAIIALPLSNSPEVCLINFSDYELCSKYIWYLAPNGYVSSHDLNNYDGVMLSRLILKTIQLVDHIDRNPLNNIRKNLRPCSVAQNQFNRLKPNIPTTSKYKDVVWHKTYKKWQAQIRAHRVRYYLGRFNTEEEAAIAYNKAAIKYHGEFACLNELKK